MGFRKKFERSANRKKSNEPGQGQLEREREKKERTCESRRADFPFKLSPENKTQEIARFAIADMSLNKCTFRSHNPLTEENMLPRPDQQTIQTMINAAAFEG